MTARAPVCGMFQTRVARISSDIYSNPHQSRAYPRIYSVIRHLILFYQQKVLHEYILYNSSD